MPRSSPGSTTVMLSDDGSDVCAYLTVADCSRTTQLEVDVHDRDTAANPCTRARALKAVVDGSSPRSSARSQSRA